MAVVGEIGEDRMGTTGAVGGMGSGSVVNSLANGTLPATGGGVGCGEAPLQANAADGVNASAAFDEAAKECWAEMAADHSKFKDDYGKVVHEQFMQLQQKLSDTLVSKISDKLAIAAAAVGDGVSLYMLSVVLCV